MAGGQRPSHRDVPAADGRATWVGGNKTEQGLVAFVSRIGKVRGSGRSSSGDWLLCGSFEYFKFGIDNINVGVRVLIKYVF